MRNFVFKKAYVVDRVRSTSYRCYLMYVVKSVMCIGDLKIMKLFSINKLYIYLYMRGLRRVLSLNS